DALKVHALELRNDDEAAIRLKVSQQILEAVGSKNASMFAKQADEIVRLTLANTAFANNLKAILQNLEESKKATEEVVKADEKWLEVSREMSLLSLTPHE